MLTLLTLNLANYDDHPDWPQRLQIMVDAIVAAQPDVIAVQEVRFDPSQPTTEASYQSMAEQLVYLLDQQASYAGLSIVSQPLMFYPDPSDQYPAPPPATQLWEGLAILSRLPIVQTGAIFLSQPGSDRNRRGTQHAAVTSGDTTVHVFNTHFALDAIDQASNAVETIAYLAGFSGPQILVGDLNAIPSAPAVAALTAAGLTDAWASLEPGAYGYTWPSNDPAKRIDYGFVNAALSAQSVELVLTQPVGGIYASDHLGLVFTLEP
jgi:endonuclease/exonuclease/phosphatase family metal-dependent hydrolase